MSCTVRGLTSFLTGCAAAALVACGGGSQTSGFGTGPGADGGGGDGGSLLGADGGVIGAFGDSSTNGHSDAPTSTCTNLQCQVHSCKGGGSTTITGKVTDPAGNNPLYNVVAYIPNSANGKLDLIPSGVNSASCSCGALFSGEPMADGLTAADGTFTIKNAPDGTNIPLVVQIGKWRKEITIPKVSECESNQAGTIALPKNLTDGAYASIPNIAVSTGAADTLECLLARVGLDDSQFSGDPNTPSARVHVFEGNGHNTVNPSGPSSPTSLWDSTADLNRYDIVMFSCEGTETLGVDGTTATDLAAYVNGGGRVFGEHYHYAFFTQYTSNPGVAYPEFANVANWNDVQGSGGSYPGNVDTVIQTKLPNGKPFPEGQALETWLGNVGALSGSNLVVPAGNARHNGVVDPGNLATPWAQTTGVSPASTQYFSWDMPFNAKENDAGVPQYCGRVVYSDLHVSGSGQSDSDPVPTGCAQRKLSDDEDALEFILFDLSSCVTPAGTTPLPPQPDGGMMAQ